MLGRKKCDNKNFQDRGEKGIGKVKTTGSKDEENDRELMGSLKILKIIKLWHEKYEIENEDFERRNKVMTKNMKKNKMIRLQKVIKDLEEKVDKSDKSCDSKSICWGFSTQKK